LTEIPEHLLKRSKERRAALGLPGGESGGGDAGSGDSGAAASSDAPATPAKAAAPAPAKVEEKPPPPPKPKPEYIQAAEKRKRIPYWAMPVLVLLPVWALVYADGVTPPPSGDEQLIAGEEIYPGTCGTCHGPTGGGGTGPQLSDGEVLLTFPDPVAMMEWIHLGAEEWTGSTSATDYGDPNREGGPHNTGEFSAIMPGFTDLTPEELAGVTRYVREELSGEAPASPELQEEYLLWAEAAIENSEAGELIYRDGVLPDDERIARAESGE
jgi:mono/diheme cytochrome c family protein